MRAKKTNEATITDRDDARGHVGDCLTVISPDGEPKEMCHTIIWWWNAKNHAGFIKGKVSNGFEEHVHRIWSGKEREDYHGNI